MELSVIEIPEDPCPELLLWGLSHENYGRIRDFILDHPYNCGEDAEPYELFVCMLNNSGVPPLEGEDDWTMFHLECVRSYMIRHARRIKRRKELDETIGKVWSALQVEGHRNDNGDLADTGTRDSDAVEKWDNEAVAAKVLAELLDGIAVKRDTQRGPDSRGVHDYDIALRNGRVVALEITQEVDVASRRQAGYVQKHNLTIAGLRHNWSVELNHRCDPRPAYKCLPDVLERLEELDIRDVSALDSQHQVPFLRKLRELGIMSAHRAHRNEVSIRRGEVHIVQHLGSGWRLHSDAMKEVVDSALCRKAEKLRRANADERHLWIWIDFTLDSILLSELHLVDDLRFTVPSMSEGSIGERVDVVWVAIAAVTEGHTTVILKCDGNEWSRIELSEDTHRIIADAIQRSTSR